MAARAWGEGGFDNKNMEKFWGAILFYLDCGGGDQTKYFTNISCGGARGRESSFFRGRDRVVDNKMATVLGQA